MHNARIDTTQGLDGEAVVLAVFDLGDEEIAASAHAVKVFSAERFRNAELSIDDVLELRELTALADELDDHSISNTRVAQEVDDTTAPSARPRRRPSCCGHDEQRSPLGDALLELL